jgi:putative ABC transport system permease protein
MIILLTIIRVALKALGRNKMRSILTMLGIIIGVGAVIAMVSIGQGAQATIAAQIANAGSNMLYVWPGSFREGGFRSGAGTMSTLTVEDALAIQRECSAVRSTSPVVSTRAPVVYGNQNWMPSIEGVNINYPSIKLWELESGSFFTEQDETSAQRVCLVGKTVVDNLFAGLDPVGQEIRVRNAPWRVIGVLKPKGQSGMGSDQDDVIVAPYTTVQKKLLGITHIHRIMISAISQAASSTAEQQITDLLRQRHRIAPTEESDFSVRNLSDVAELADSSNRVMTLLLGSIAFVSLIVGGIGVMNIMLVSVTERTREIGIRLAVGATGGDIQFQFLTEAVVLAVFGGILGITSGVATAKVISDFLRWPTLVSTSAIVMAFSFAGAIGIAAGWYPALKASRLDPIEALRYD